jgi:1-acyl-sn-glycerol-3-phosphate acyltransferase
LPFKHGAFTLALEAGVPVVPVAIHGGHALIPKHGKTLSSTADLLVEVLDPVAPDFTDATSFANAVRARIEESLAARRQARGEALAPVRITSAERYADQA